MRHILVEYPLYFNLRNRFGLANEPLSFILGIDAPVEEIRKFLKEINLFYDI